MADSNKYVVAGKPKVGGAIFRAVPATALPANETAALAAAYKAQGYANEDGLKRTIEKAYETIRAWGGDIAKRSRTELTVTLEFVLIQAADPEPVKSVWGDAAVTVTAATASAGTKIAIAYAGTDVGESVWVFDLADGGHVRRIVCPRGENTTESFEQEFTDSSVISMPVTLTLYPDSAGKYFYEYSDDGIKTA